MSALQSPVIVEEEDINDINTATDDREEIENSQNSFGHIPVNLNERSAHAEESTETSNFYALENIQSLQKVDFDEESLKKKPWRRAGVDITDYFNYGFDEKSWSAYCKKQSKLCVLRRKLHAKIRAQRGHTRYGEEEPQSSRETCDTMGSACREESYRCFGDRGSSSQVDAKMSHQEDMSAFLTAGHNRSSPYAFISPQSFQMYPASLDSGCSKDFDGPSTSQHHFSFGSMAISAGAINSAKAWEHMIWQERYTRERGLSSVHGNEKDSKRNQHKENDGFACSWEEEQKKHRDTTERERKHGSFEKVSGEERQRDKSEGQREASQSNRSTSNRSGKDDDRKDRESRRKKRRKKTKRSRKDKKS